MTPHNLPLYISWCAAWRSGELLSCNSTEEGSTLNVQLIVVVQAERSVLSLSRVHVGARYDFVYSELTSSEPGQMS